MEGQCVKWLHLDYGMIRSLDHRKWSGSTFVGAHLYQRRLQARITWFVNDPLPCPFLGFLLLMMITFLGTHRLPKPQAFESRQKKFIKKLCGSCAHATKVNGSLLTWVMTFQKKFLYSKIVPKVFASKGIQNIINTWYFHIYNM